jgi:hypothetical protein
MRKRVTPEAVAAYRAGDADALRRALRLKPWEASPLDVGEHGCVYPLGTAYAQSWPQALELRQELDRAD